MDLKYKSFFSLVCKKLLRFFYLLSSGLRLPTTCEDEMTNKRITENINGLNQLFKAVFISLLDRIESNREGLE